MTSRARPTSRERGSVSLWAVLVAVTLIIMVGMAVDFGGQAVTEQRARAVAGEAARAGGQEVELDAAARGTDVRIDAEAAAAAARDYLYANGLSGSAKATGPNGVEVTVTDRYQTQFLSVIGIESLPVTGKASATIVRSFEGNPR